MIKLSEKLAELKQDDDFTNCQWFEQDDPDDGYITAYVLVNIAPVPLGAQGVARSRKKALQFAYENLAKAIKQQP